MSVKILGLDMFLMLMVMQVVGGLGVYPGTAFAAFVVLFANEYLRAVDQYRPIVFGVAVVLLVIFLPRGILGTLSAGSGPTPLEYPGQNLRNALRLRRRAAASSEVVVGEGAGKDKGEETS